MGLSPDESAERGPEHVIITADAFDAAPHTTIR
jgi:hypothetical protein